MRQLRIFCLPKLRGTALVFLFASACFAEASKHEATGLPTNGADVLPPNSLFNRTVGGLEKTHAFSRIEPVSGQAFSNVLRVTIALKAKESNTTQLTIPNSAAISKGDVLLASFHFSGAAINNQDPAHIEFLFEKSTSPWTKSVTAGFSAPSDPDEWKHVLVPFESIADYKPGEAMASLRFAFEPQTVEIADLRVLNYTSSVSLADLYARVAAQTPLGNVTARVHQTQKRQIITGFGGNFAQPRYSSTNAMDAVGQYNLDNLRIVHARIGLPLNHWAPKPGIYREDGPAKAALEQMRIMAQRKIPITASIWEGPEWILPGKPETSRSLPKESLNHCIEAIAKFLLVARDNYGAVVDTISFNEPEYGVNFKFTPRQLADFIRKAGPRFAELGLVTRFLVADTATGGHFADFAHPIIEDSEIAPFLGPLAFHCWDALNAPASSYTAIAELGKRLGKPIWCMEAGHDSDLWRANNQWATWENALRIALAYERTLRLSGATLMDYWTYQNNYPLVSQDGLVPFSAWHVLRQLEDAFPPGSQILAADSDADALKILPALGPQTNRLSVLLINTAGDGMMKLTGLLPRSQFTITRSMEAIQSQKEEQPVFADVNGCLAIRISPRSVVTLITEGLSTPAQ